VAISPAVSHHRTILFDAPLKRVDPGTTATASIKKTTSAAIAAKQTPQYVNKKPMLTKKSLSDPQVGVPKKAKWNVEHSTLKARPSPSPTTPYALPPPQKCTSRLVQHTSADIISGRISTTLQSRSIQAKYCKSAAKCRTLDFVKFYIRLYAVPGGDDEGGVLVELQRVSGDYLSFMYDCRAILDAAEGKDVIMDTNDVNNRHCPSKKALYLRLPVSEMSFACDDNTILRHDLKTTQDDEDIINITSELLSSPQSDSNMLGMESLVSLVDVNVTSKSTAILASKRLVCTRHQPDNGPFSLHNYVMSLIIYEDDHEDDDDDDSSLEEDATSAVKFSLNRSIAEHTRRLRTHALTSLSNALELLYSENMLCETISASKEWYASVLIPRLIENVKCASTKPHDATLAARCLTSLAMCSHVFASTMKESDGGNVGCLSALERAGEIGRDEFELLSRDCERCQSTLLRC